MEIQALRNNVIAHSLQVANLFPMMSDDELRALADDIKANGLREPIWRDLNSLIVDGRNRWIACQLAGVECHALKYEPDEHGVVAFVVSQNVHRRHLTVGQRALIADELTTLHHGQRVAQNCASVSQPKAAGMMGVSRRSAQEARVVRERAPELAEQVKQGTLSVSKAASLASAASPPRKPRDPNKPPAPQRKRKPKAEPTNVVPEEVTRFRMWISSGSMLVSQFPNGAGFRELCERSGVAIDDSRLDDLVRFIAGIRAGKAVRAA